MTYAFKRYLSDSVCGALLSPYPYQFADYCGRKPRHRGDHMVRPDRVETSNGMVTVHNETQCASDEACVIHNPSEHKMVKWPMIIRLDKRALVERKCTHGVGHPDPDSVMYFVRTRNDTSMWAHGCDGCCAS